MGPGNAHAYSGSSETPQGGECTRMWLQDAGSGHVGVRVRLGVRMRQGPSQAAPKVPCMPFCVPLRSLPEVSEFPGRGPHFIPLRTHRGGPLQVCWENEQNQLLVNSQLVSSTFVSQHLAQHLHTGGAPYMSGN